VLLGYSGPRMQTCSGGGIRWGQDQPFFTKEFYSESMTSPKKTVRAMRVQYAALPYRQKGDSSTEVLLVTSRDTGRWIIPKGWPVKGKAPHRAAAREAHEEAGVVGKINRRAMGSFSYEKRLKSGRIIVCKVKVFGLKVKEQEKSWPEKSQRKVKWLSRTKAAKTVRDRALGAIIRALHGQVWATLHEPPTFAPAPALRAATF
jgi:8-oxo-dGTP pyrophosphatase MutT (NUDIX family)